MAYLKQKTPQKREREIYEKFGNSSEEELNIKSNKNIYVKNGVMTIIIKRCRGDK